MGLSSSQARLLNLTARMHDIEYKAQNLEAQKLQMANESAHVYQEYENALNKTKVQFKTISTDGSAKYESANLNTLLSANYKIKIFAAGKWITYSKDNISDNKITIPKKLGDEETDKSITTAATKDYEAGEIYKEGTDYYVLSKPVKTGGTKITGCKFPTEDENLETFSVTDYDILNNLAEAGFIIFEKPTLNTDGTYTYDETNIATDTNLQEVSDDIELKKAEAKYEADMRKINQKDKKFDTDLAALEAERNAIKTEMETLKSVAKENVDRTYKLFS